VNISHVHGYGNIIFLSVLTNIFSECMITSYIALPPSHGLLSQNTGLSMTAEKLTTAIRYLQFVRQTLFSHKWGLDWWVRNGHIPVNLQPRSSNGPELGRCFFCIGSFLAQCLYIMALIKGNASGPKLLNSSLGIQPTPRSLAYLPGAVCTVCTWPHPCVPRGG